MENTHFVIYTTNKFWTLSTWKWEPGGYVQVPIPTVDDADLRQAPIWIGNDNVGYTL